MTFRFILDLIRPHVRNLFGSIACMGIVSATLGLQVVLVRVVLDRLLIKGERNGLIFLPLAIFGVYSLHALAEVGRGYFARKAAQGMMDTLRVRVFTHVQKQSLDFFSEHDPGVLSERVLKDSESANVVVTLIITLLQKPLSLILLVGLALRQAPMLTLVAFLGLPLVLLPMRWMRVRIRDATSRKLDANARLLSLLHEVQPSAETTKLFRLEPLAVQRFTNASRSAHFSNLKATLAMLSSGPVVQISAALGAALIVYLGGQAVIEGRTTPGALMAFIVSLGLMNDPLKSLAQVPLLWTQARIGLERIQTLLEQEPAIQDAPGAFDLHAQSCEIAFHGVGFKRGEQEILREIHFRIRPGEAVALIGETGAGKTTILRLIPRLLEPSKGSITINGHDIRTLRLNSLRELIAVVPQDPFLFEGTIEENIRAGRRGLPKERIHHAARMACAEDFIQNLPERYQTRVGPGGIRLSGGERQRIAIARAIVKDSPILLLDEPTSALDEETEKRLQQNLKEWFHQKTLLIVSHRTSIHLWTHRRLCLSNGTLNEFDV